MNELIRFLLNTNSNLLLSVKNVGKTSCLLFLCLFTTPLKSEELQDVETLIQNIRSGGYILYMRHAQTNRSQTDTEIDDLSDCSTQRNLSLEGQKQAKLIGNTLQKLNIPIGKINTSPYCRCFDTAQLAFGRADKFSDLRFTISTNQQETQRLAEVLKNLLATEPNAGTNTILVGHTGNLREATGVWPKPEGVIHIFKPLREKGFEHLGRITPAQWHALNAEI